MLMTLKKKNGRRVSIAQSCTVMITLSYFIEGQKLTAAVFLPNTKQMFEMALNRKETSGPLVWGD